MIADITVRLRQCRADMLGTDDEPHYWDCHAAADEIERLRLAKPEREAIVRAWHGLLKLMAFEKQLADVHLADATTINALLERTRNG